MIRQWPISHDKTRTAATRAINLVILIGTAREILRRLGELALPYRPYIVILN